MKKRYKILILVLLILTIPLKAYAFVFTGVATVVGFVTDVLVGAGILGGMTAAAVATYATWGLTALGYSQIAKALTPDVPGAVSSTYSGPTPVLTAQAGAPVPEANGIVFLSGHIVRQNDFSDEDYIDVLVDYGKGEWDEILATYINGIEWNELIGSGHVKYEHLGTSDQAAINTLFSDGDNFRNHVIGEYRLKKNKEITTLQNIQVIARTRKCLEIGQNIGGTESFTRNPAQILWDFYLKVKKADYTNEMNPAVNAWSSLEEYCAESLCDSDTTYYQVNVLAPSSDLVKATSYYNKNYKPHNVINTDNQLTGHGRGMSWLTGVTTNRRINFDFGRKVVITRIQICNYHNSGSETDRGINSFALQGSNTAADLSYTSYADGESGWTDVHAGLTASEHAGSDTSDIETIAITNVNGYRYYSLKIASNHGDGTYMGFRQVRFFTGNASGACSNDEVNIRCAFDYNNDSKITINDYEKILWASFNGMIIRSQGTYKPVWEGSQEADGAGSLQAKSSQHTFTVSTNVVEKSLTWNLLEHPNIYIVNFIDSADKFRKCSDATIKNDQDIDIKGEHTNEETCWFLIDYCLAARRVKYRHDKGQYTDYQTGLTGFPDSQGLEMFDLVAVTDTQAGFSSKSMLVVSKNEDQYGRSQFLLESYLVGVYTWKGFERQLGYPSRTSSIITANNVPTLIEASGSTDAGEAEPDIIVTDSIFDGDRDSGGMSFGMCCTEEPHGAFAFDDGSTDDDMDPGEGILLYVTGGCGPFTFETSNTGYSFDDGTQSYTTWNRYATLYCDTGTCGVDFDAYCDFTVTDDCSTEVSGTIYNTDGGWPDVDDYDDLWTPSGYSGICNPCEGAGGGSAWWVTQGHIRFRALVDVNCKTTPFAMTWSQGDDPSIYGLGDCTTPTDAYDVFTGEEHEVECSYSGACNGTECHRFIYNLRYYVYAC